VAFVGLGRLQVIARGEQIEPGIFRRDAELD
jgi:hypothetical protein